MYSMRYEQMVKNLLAINNLIPHLLIKSILFKGRFSKKGQNLTCCSDFDLQWKVYGSVWCVHVYMYQQ